MEYGYIYKVTNTVNGKVYVGQTKDTVEIRWKKHLDNAKNNPDKQIICKAMSKYGVDNFNVEEICRVPFEDLDFFEVYYIKKYDSFQNGYNMTPGGYVPSNYHTEEQALAIIKLAQGDEKTNIKKIAEEVGISTKAVSKFLKKYDIQILNHESGSRGNVENLRPYFGQHLENLVQPLPVRVVELDKSFKSLIECAAYLIDNNYTKTKNERNVMKSISRAMSNNGYGRNTYLGFHFEKLNNTNK